MAKAVNKMTPVDELMVKLFHPPRVLVVEDAASTEAILRRNYDCRVDTTRDGHEAAELLASQKYDLVLIDLVLLNGTSELVLKAVEKYAPDVPVVATRVDNIDEVLANLDSVTLLKAPLTFEMLQRLFRVFKIKARTREIAEYCTDLARATSPITGLAG